MKNLVSLLVLAILASSCTQEHSKDYVTFSGKFENSNNSSAIQLLNNSGEVLKTLTLKADGTFKDSLQIPNPQVLTLQLGQKRAPVFLKNGYDVQFTGDANNFMKSFVFSGYGSDSNNFITSQVLETQKLGNPMLIFALDTLAYQEKMASIKNGFEAIVATYENADSILLAQADQQLTQITSYFDTNYSAQHQQALLALNATKTTQKGMPSPAFTNYQNAKGGKNSLADFKGQFVYIDVWATWCGPCIREIPALQALEKEYKGKNVAFLSISSDEPRRSGGSWKAAEKKWKSFVKDRAMSGVQLWAGEDASFQQAYMINSIPRFILLDPQGNIIDANALRPSDPNLKLLFTELGI